MVRRTQKNESVRQTIVTNLEAPRLQGVALKDFVKFKKARELYEQQVEEKNRDPGTQIAATSYKASIDKALLRIMIAAEWVPVSSLNELTEEHLVSCVAARAVYSPQEHESSRIDEIVSDIKMDTSIRDAESRVWSMFQKYVERLESYGMGDLPEEKPHVVIRHMLVKVEPKDLRERMKSIVFWRKDRQFDKKDANAFLRELVAQAKKFDDMKLFGKRGRDTNLTDSENSGTESDEGAKRSRKKRRKSGRSNSQKAPENRAGDEKGSSSSKSRRPPKCLNPTCTEHHWLSDCPTTSEEEKKRLRAEYRKRKENSAKKKTSGSVNQVSGEGNHSALFSGAFAHGAVEIEALADQGSDPNLISSSTFQQLCKADPNLQVEILDRPARFGSINQRNAVLCDKLVTADVLLRIRHGTQLLLRNVVWHVSQGELAHVIIGRSVLEAIGCDNQALLAAASDKAGGVLDARMAIRERAREKTGTINAVVDADSPGLFHRQGGVEEDLIPEGKVYMELGEDTPEELTEALDNSIQRASENGLSDEGTCELRRMLAKHRAIFG